MEDTLSSIIYLSIVIKPMTISVIIGLLVLLFLLLVSAFVSGSEVAFFSLTPKDKEHFKNNSHSKNKVVELLKSPDKLLATILIVNNLVNIGVVILSTYISNAIFDFSEHPQLGFLFQIIVITFVLLLFGEIIPKVYAARFPIGFTKLTASPLQFLSYIFSPLSFLLIKSSHLIQNRLNKKKQQVSIDELSDALDLTEQEEIIDDTILKGIVNFGNKKVSTIMRSRMDVTTINIKDKYNKVKEIIRASGYSRIPVILETFDNVKGLLYIKDLLPHAEKPDTFRWQSVIRPAFYVPESKKIDDLLRDFQTKKIHLAIVVDEYGGTSGIVTLEDVLEEIIGEINDEFDQVEEWCIPISEHLFEVEGKTLLIDFCKKFELEDDFFFEEDRADADTLAGFILELKGEIPEKKDSIYYKHFTFEIKSVDNRRIKQVLVRINDNTQEQPSDSNEQE